MTRHAYTSHRVAASPYAVGMYERHAIAIRRLASAALLAVSALVMILGADGCVGRAVASAPEVTRATVVRHTDGDTAIFVLADGATEKVRLIGVDTPEVNGEEEPFGAEASAYTAEAMPGGATVWLQTDVDLRDRYGRLLAYVWLERPAAGGREEARERMLNARLLLDGYAQTLTVPPNVAYAEDFVEFQAEAREAGLGLWGEEGG